jgi:uncharacterized repeat protein (TIGR01451 family)
VTNCTFEGNFTTLSPGGGIANGGTAELRNTIMVNNNPGGNCNGTITDGGYNIDDGMTCGFMAANNSQPNTDPELDPMGLQDNGGPTQTIALQPTSPAIDAIPVADCTDIDGNQVDTDQRTFVRPADGDGDNIARCDIGAFEFDAIPIADLNISKASDKNPVKSGKNLTYTIIVSNEGISDAEGIVMNDPIPGGTTYVSFYTTDFGGCISPPVGSTGTLSCNLATLSNGEEAMVKFVVKVNARGKSTISNTATVNSLTADSNIANNSATLLTNVFGSRK